MHARDARPVGGTTASFLRPALGAGALAGLFLGGADGLVAASRMESGGFALAGAVAAAVLVYGGLWCGLLLAAAALLHPWLRRRGEAQRTAVLLGLALGAWLTLEIYWWTRPWVFHGYSSLSYAAGDGGER